MSHVSPDDLCRWCEVRAEKLSRHADRRVPFRLAVPVASVAGAGDKNPYAAGICRLVGAPQSCKLVSLIPIGYPAESLEKSKRPLSDVLHWERH